MAKPAKRKVPGGRVTPKGGPAATSRTTPSPSSRYTPPVPREMKVSPRWVPVLMFALLGVGLLVIFLNYLGLLPALWWDEPPGGDGTSNWYLVIGLAFILGGIVTATQYR